MREALHGKVYSSLWRFVSVIANCRNVNSISQQEGGFVQHEGHYRVLLGVSINWFASSIEILTRLPYQKR